MCFDDSNGKMKELKYMKYICFKPEIFKHVLFSENPDEAEKTFSKLNQENE